MIIQENKIFVINVIILTIIVNSPSFPFNNWKGIIMNDYANLQTIPHQKLNQRYLNQI